MSVINSNIVECYQGLSTCLVTLGMSDDVFSIILYLIEHTPNDCIPKIDTHFLISNFFNFL